MLIISRRAGQSFFIGDEIQILILEGSAKVGISAPSRIEVPRTDLIPPGELVEVSDGATELAS